jgi:hypothetical protein
MNWKRSLGCAAAVSLVICSIWQARSEGTGEAVTREKQDTGIRIESAMGKGFGKVFKQELVFEQGLYEPGTMAAESGKPFWTAHLTGSSHSIEVQGRTADAQKKVEDWARLHPGAPVRALAYETVVAGGVPELTPETAHDNVPIWQGQGWSAGPKLIVFDLIP